MNKTKVVLSLFMVLAMIGTVGAQPTAHSEIHVSGNKAVTHSMATNDAYAQDIKSVGCGIINGKGTLESGAVAGSEYNNFFDRNRWTAAYVDITNAEGSLFVGSEVDAQLSGTELDSEIYADVPKRTDTDAYTYAGFTQNGFEIAYNTYADVNVTKEHGRLHNVDIDANSDATIELDTGTVFTYAYTEIGKKLRYVQTGATALYNLRDLW